MVYRVISTRLRPTPWSHIVVGALIAGCFAVGVVALDRAVEYAPVPAIAVLVAWAFLLFGNLARIDPLGFLAVTLPPVLIVVFGPREGDALWVVTALVLAWLALWSSRPWLTWTMRARLAIALRPHSSEAVLIGALRRIVSLFEQRTSPKGAEEIDRALADAAKAWSPNNDSLVAGLQVLGDIWLGGLPPDAEEGVVRRLMRRLHEEVAYMLVGRRPQTPTDGSGQDARPAWGTRLEYLYPELEPLVSAASPEQSRQMATEAAVVALEHERVPLIDEKQWPALLTDAEVRAETRARVSEMLGLARSERDSVSRSAEAADPNGGTAAERAIALRVALRALDDEIEPVDASEAIYDALRLDLPSRKRSELRRALTTIAGAPLATRTPVNAAPTARRRADYGLGGESTWLTSARWQYALLLGAVGGSIGAVAMLLLVGATGDVLVRLGVFASVTALVVHVASIRSIARPVDAMLELLSIGVIAFVVAEPILQFLADAGFATGPSELGARSAVYAATTAVGLVVVRAAHLRHAPARASFLRPIAR